MNKIEEALEKRFQDHRIIFWYDEKEELKDEYEALELDGVQKIHVQANEFEVKYIVNKVSPKSRFLLYFNCVKPVNEENWLLDMELAHHVFHTDQEALFLQELGLGYHLKELVAEHIEFFKSSERRQKLKDLLGAGDEYQAVRYKMLAVVFGIENLSLESFIHAYATAFANGNESYTKELGRYNLSKYFWNQIAGKYNYQTETPGIYDFLIEVFSKSFVLSEKSKLGKESRLLLSLWKDTIHFRDSFAVVSDRIATDIDAESKIDKASIDEIINDDLFRLTDYKVIHELIKLIIEEQISIDRVSQYIKLRENKFWFDGVENLFQALKYGAKMISMVRSYPNMTYNSFNDGVEHYAAILFDVDQAYRKFIWYYRKSSQNKILSKLTDKVEKVYSNDWLLTYSNNWQSVIDNLKQWPDDTKTSQQLFFNTHVRPFIKKKQRLFVIISDALRYECGEELSKRLQSEKRFESSIEHMVSCLPSYTQFGMASLLPHKEFTIKNKSDIINVDGMPSAGAHGRSKILATNSGVRATAIKAEDFMRMNSATEGREFVKQYDLIYIYHNRIDKAGDDKTSEEKVFEAVEDEMKFLMEMLKKVAAMNGNNMMVTSDHGFIYQHSELDESDFCVSGHTGEVWKENRRFVIGRGLKGDASTRAFKGSELSLSSEVDILIPKSTNRLRVKGAGSRFIHGGSSLQEIVIPLLKITKKRQDTTAQVEIDIIKTTDRITTNILAVSFIQSNLVTDKILPRSIRASIYADDGEILSDQFKYNFDIDEGSERQREVKFRFQLSGKASGKYNRQRVKLILEEPIKGTTKWRQYKDYYYTLNISFTNDFDDF